eukprot:TRINITY_DN21476_c0_g2_i2.p1 TRINITY_DN21476_c0_g2~~TRINITY_DN21476_c0_g2_i2.p1  ORF type:complete len:395 (+),score=58.25 TRINITY_DN21476_c0_g2_i2:77-1261(+)
MLLAAATAAAGAEPVPPGRAARPCVPRTVPAWRRHARELYDLLTLTTLESPTLCLAWRPGPVPCVDGWSLHHLLLGTDSAEDVVQRPFPRAAVQQQRNFLCVVRVALPDGGDYVEEEESGDRPPERSRPGEDLRPHVDTVKRVNHAGAVCAMTHLPQHPDFAVTGSLFGDLLVFDLLDCPAEAPRDGRCRPGARLSHHEAPCWSVAASAHEEGLLPSGASDGHLCLWDLRGRGATCGELAMGPRRVLKAPHGGRPVREVAFHPSSRCLLASVGDDGRLCVWDTRTPGLAGAAWAGDTTTAVAASAPGEHGSSCRALAFAPSANGLLATAGQDGTVRLWDLRRLGCEHSGRAFKASASTPLQLLAGSSPGRGDGCCCFWRHLRRGVGLRTCGARG